MVILGYGFKQLTRNSKKVKKYPEPFPFWITTKKGGAKFSPDGQKKRHSIKSVFFYPHEIGPYSVRLSVFTFAFSFGLQACSPKQMASAIS